MTNLEFSKGLKYLGSFFNKTFTEEEENNYYEFLKGYSYEKFIKALKHLVKTNKFIPKMSEIILACEKFNDELSLVIKLLIADGFFDKYKKIYSEHKEQKIKTFQKHYNDYKSAKICPEGHKKLFRETEIRLNVKIAEMQRKPLKLQKEEKLICQK